MKLNAMMALGMRDFVSGEFIGNAASSGSFTAKEYPRPGFVFVVR